MASIIINISIIIITIITININIIITIITVMQKGTIKPLQPTGLTLKHKLLSDSLKRFSNHGH